MERRKRSKGSKLLELKLEQLDITQDEAGRRAGITPGEICRLLNGTRSEVELTTADKLYSAFEIPYKAWSDFSEEEKSK